MNRSDPGWGLPSSLASQAFDVLAKHLPKDVPCALLDFPDHPNVGDSAIWVGERIFMRRHGVPLRYVSSIHNFSEDLLRKAMPEGIVLLHGGGNLGSVWPQHQSHRETILARLRDYKVVQFPQSVHFDDAAQAARFRALVEAHPDFTLLVRDRESQDYARQELGIGAALCPDTAFFLAGRLHRERFDVECLVLARSDKERKVCGLEEALKAAGINFVTADWLDEPASLTKNLALALRRRSQGRLAQAPLFERLLVGQWDRLAQARIERGRRLLSRGRVVVTDRLHAHILCAMMGIPHVILDNSYGKVGRFVRQWTGGLSSCRQARCVEEAAALCRDMLRQPPSEPAPTIQ